MIRWREPDIINWIRNFADAAPVDRALVKGIGDDCAILRAAAREDLVFTTDFLLEDRHFTRHTHSATDIGHKALARSLSDVAAMGAEPVLCLISLGIPADLAGAWVKRFYAGVLSIAPKYRTTLAGGDLARFEKIIVDVMCCGRVPRGKALLRSAAKPGDSIYVTGTLGKDWRRNRRPEPRIEAGIAIRRLGVRAAMDLSDGLSLDLRRMCLESQVSAEISADLSEQALHGGEDYELLFTASRKIPGRIAALPITKIGVMTAGHPGRVLFQGRPLEPRGFDHFAASD
ncbi:MAG TPA: thiamine-phosphate kinase [Bryobacteraceae bacterium]|jgi:thiamine-monophosphate kinase|nr:thiamine-phosphate kinase [Bryobacteraceae bacterium]